MTTAELSERTGATLRQLQWWDEQGVVRVRIKDHSRIYDELAVRKVTAIVELRRKGVSLRGCRAAAQAIDRDPVGEWLIVAGNKAMVRASDLSAIDTAAALKSGVCVVRIAT